VFVIGLTASGREGEIDGDEWQHISYCFCWVYAGNVPRICWINADGGRGGSFEEAKGVFVRLSLMVISEGWRRIFGFVWKYSA